MIGPFQWTHVFIWSEKETSYSIVCHILWMCHDGETTCLQQNSSSTLEKYSADGQRQRGNMLKLYQDTTLYPQCCLTETTVRQLTVHRSPLVKTRSYRWSRASSPQRRVRSKSRRLTSSEGQTRPREASLHGSRKDEGFWLRTWTGDHPRSQSRENIPLQTRRFLIRWFKVKWKDLLNTMRMVGRCTECFLLGQTRVLFVCRADAVAPQKGNALGAGPCARGPMGSVPMDRRLTTAKQHNLPATELRQTASG